MKKRIAAKGISEEERRAAAAAMGSARTPAKTAAARRNGFKPGHSFGKGRSPVPLLEIDCSCEAGEALDAHHWRCPRGQAIKRRQKEGRDVLTGQKIGATA